MSKIEWEYDLVERPFCEQLKAMGWQWLEGDVDVPDRTDLEAQLRDTARLSGETLRPNDDDKRARESSSKRTQRILTEPTPDIVFAMLQKYQDASKRDAAEKVSMTVVRRERKSPATYSAMPSSSVSSTRWRRISTATLPSTSSGWARR